MQPRLVLRFTLGLVLGTSIAITIPRAENGTLQQRTTIYFPGPIPGRSDARAVHDVQVPAELASRSSSDATTTALLVRGDENGDNSSNNGKGASKRSASAVEATPGTKSDKSDPKEVAEAVTKDTFALIGKIALGVLIPVIICVVVVVWYKHHKKGVKKELENLKSMRQKGWYGSDGSFTTSKYRSRRMV